MLGIFPFFSHFNISWCMFKTTRMNEKKTPNQFHEITFHFAWILYRFLCIFYYPSVSANCKGGYDGWGFSENEKNTSSDMLDI